MHVYYIITSTCSILVGSIQFFLDLGDPNHGKTWGIDCTLSFHEVLWERKIPKNLEITLEATSDYATLAHFSTLKVNGIKSEDFPSLKLTCVDYFLANRNTLAMPTTENLACLADVKIPLPEGKTNPPLKCVIDE